MGSKEQDSLPEIESLQRALCIAHKLMTTWAARWRGPEGCLLKGGDPDALEVYLAAEAIGSLLQEHCGQMGLDYKYHLDKPPSIAGEAYLDKIWDSEANDWRQRGKK